MSGHGPTTGRAPSRALRARRPRRPLTSAPFAPPSFLNGSTVQSIDDLWGVDQCRGARLPLVQVPTTAGTGSEVTPISIITTGEGQKKGVVSSQLLPDVAICDGDLTLSVPAHVTAATGIDAMVCNRHV